MQGSDTNFRKTKTISFIHLTIIDRQVVMPLSLRKSLVGEYHISTLSGHLAYRRTFQKLRDKFYWPSMLNDIREYCQKCEECARQKKI